MTKQEAIEMLTMVRHRTGYEKIPVDEFENWEKQYNEALDIAIKELKKNHVIKVQIDLSPVEEMVKETVAEAIKNYDKLRR